jgi:hypothetical protein
MSGVEEAAERFEIEPADLISSIGIDTDTDPAVSEVVSRLLGNGAEADESEPAGMDGSACFVPKEMFQLGTKLSIVGLEIAVGEDEGSVDGSMETTTSISRVADEVLSIEFEDIALDVDMSIDCESMSISLDENSKGTFRKD